MMSITSVLERIHRWAEQNDPDFVALLQPGLSRLEIDAQVGGLPFALAEEVYDLYQWHNGQSDGDFHLGLDQTSFSPFMPLQEALSEYTRFQAEKFQIELENSDCEFAESGGWFPLFGMERYYTATLGQKAGELASPLVGVTREDRTYLRYPTLQAMLEFRADLYESGAMRHDEEEWYWADYTVGSVILRQHFPEKAVAAENNYRKSGRLDSQIGEGYNDLESQRHQCISDLVTTGSKLAVPVVKEYLQEHIADKGLADSVLHDLLTQPHKVSSEWPWTRNMYIGSLGYSFQID